MANYAKFNQFTKDLIDAKHLFGSHVFKVMLTNTAPLNTNSLKANITELAAGNGYPAGGATTTITVSAAGGVARVIGTSVTFTATGSLGPFRYAVLYNDTQTSPAKPLIGWWDYGAPISLAATESFVVAFDAANGIFTVA